jgi:phosphoglycerate dehydrogenase-like enzyme
VGIGAIGAATAKRALAFDMQILAYRRTRSPSPLPNVDLVSGLDELLGASDHIVVAAPATPATYHLFDANAFARMKRGAHLINVSRGALVDQDALLKALDDESLAMATLDVTDPEPLPAGHPLYAHPRVRVSPMSAGAPPTPGVGRSSCSKRTSVGSSKENL